MIDQLERTHGSNLVRVQVKLLQVWLSSPPPDIDAMFWRDFYFDFTSINYALYIYKKKIKVETRVDIIGF